MRNHSTARHAPQVIPFPRQAQPKVDFQFCMIPDAIMRDTEIYPGAKILFGVILSSCRRGRCWMGNPELARSSGLSVKQVKRLLQELEDFDLIIRILSGNRREEIRVNLRSPKLSPLRAPSCPPDKSQVVRSGIPGCPPDSENDGEKGLEVDFSSGQGEEIDPWTRRWFGAPPGDIIDTCEPSDT